MNEYPDDPGQRIWQCQRVEGLKMSADEIRKRSVKFENKIAWRNLREYLGGLLVAILFVPSLLKTHDILFRIAFGMMLAGLAYVVIQLHRKGSAKSSPPSLGAASCLQFYRNELERQRDLVANVWPW